MRTPALVFVVGLLAAASAHAQMPAAADHNSHYVKSLQSDVDASTVAGEVRKVDRGAGKLTLRHGPISNLGMPEMTMVFRVADPTMLDGLEPADKVRFRAERVGGQITVTELEATE